MPTRQPVKPKRSFFRRLARIVGRSLLTILIILLLLFVLIQTPVVQNFVRGKAQDYLSRKLKTRVRIGHLNVALFRSVTLRDVYIEDRQRDTLLSAGLIEVQIRMLGLLHHHLDIGQVHLAGLTAKIRRELPDTAFNFQFIADAFSTPPSPAPEKPSARPMTIDLKELQLDKIRFVYQDTVTGTDVVVRIGHSVTKLDGIDLAGLRFGVPDLELNGLQATIRRVRPLSPAVAGGNAGAGGNGNGGAGGDSAAGGNAHAGAMPVLNLGRVTLASCGIDYEDMVAAVATKVRIGRLLTNIRQADLDKQIFRVNDIRLDSTDFRFDDNKQKRQASGVDFGHLAMTGLAIRARHLFYSPDSVLGSVQSAGLHERSGFNLDQLHTDFLYSAHRASLTGLYLATPGSLLQRSVVLRYDSVSGIVKDAARTLIDLDLAGSRVKVGDILLFAPALRSQPIFSRPDEVWQVTAQAKGSGDDLRIGLLRLNGARDLRIALAGRILHPLEGRRVWADLAIHTVSTSRGTLLGILPAGTIPASIRVPDRFGLRGRLTGGMSSLRSDLQLTTSSGAVSLKGWVRDFRSTPMATYDLTLHTQALQLGQILRDCPDWGPVTGNIVLEGKGLDLKSADARLNARLTSAVIRHFDYRDLSVDGRIADRRLQLESAINVSALRFKLRANADLARRYPAVQVDWQIDTADLRAMHLTSDTLAFQGHIAADFADTDPDSLRGALRLTRIRLVQGGRLIKTDSLALVAAHRGGIEDIRMHSEMADLDWNGHYTLTEVGKALKYTVSRYYTLGGDMDSAFAAQDWTMRLQLRPSPLLQALLPSVSLPDTAGVLMRFDSRTRDLRLRVASPLLRLGGLQIEEPELSVGTGEGQLSYDLEISAATGSGLELHRTRLKGMLHDNRLSTALVLEDGEEKDRYRLAGELDKLGKGFKFIFNSDSLLLNYERWTVNKDNYIRSDSAGIVVHDFRIHHNGDSLDINSVSASAAAPIGIRFSNFSLGTLSRMADQDSLLADGTVNGTVQVRNLMTQPVFSSDLVIRQLSYRADTLGDLSVRVNNEKDSAFAAELSLEGNRNDVKVKGEYITGPGRMNMQVDLGQLNLASFRHIAEHQVAVMKGYLRGQLTVAGTIDKPMLKGDLHFDSSRITPAITGEPLQLSKDNIEFDEDGFNFSQFTLRDSSGNKLVVDGNVYTKNYRQFQFDISVNAANFRLVNAPEESSRQFYGMLNLDAAMNLEGTLSAPKVDGDVRVNRKSDFFFVLPGEDPEVVGRRGVVRFINHNNPADTLVDRAALLERSLQPVMKGADISLNIRTDSAATLTMVIDERTGDILKTRGTSALVFAMDKSGKTSLTGSYEVSSGAYNLSLDVLKRSFAIQKGSTITWTGDPLSATLDLTATYTAVTPSIDLISNEVAGRPLDAQNKFKEKLPFLVTLKMTGELMKPAISFDISLPPTILSLWPDVDQRLQQIRGEESELNKQVFALLLLNRFVGEDPLQSVTGGGASVGSIAFQSASQILTNQMDQLAASLIKGVDIHFDLNNEQDYSTNSEIDYTEMDVTVSKKLFNERMQVSVGSNFDVVGVGAPNQSSTNLAGDVSVDYKLSRDGRYRLRAYRQNQYDEVVAGQVVETGVSFILTLDYNKLSDLFRRNEEEKLIERKTNKAPGSASSKQ